jgi:hypothetical protein
MKINIAEIPGFFPSGYTEQLYLDARSVRNGIDSVIIKTLEKFKVTNDETYRLRNAQTVFYDKYLLELTVPESVNIDLMNFSGQSIITLDNSEQHNAEFIEVPVGEKLGNTYFRKYILTYRDLYSKNTINHLTYDSTLNPDYSTELVIRNVATLKSKILPIFTVGEYTRTADNSNHIELVNTESAFKEIVFSAYLSENDKNTVLEYVNSNSIGTLADLRTGKAYINVITGVGTSTSYTSLETPVVTVDDSDLEGLFYVTVTMSYEQILNRPFE